MAKRKKRMVRKARLVRKFPKIANVLVQIAIFFMAACAIIFIFYREKVLELYEQAGVAASTSTVALLGLMWLMLAFFAWSLNRTIKEKLNRTSMWILFVLSLMTALSGRFESGALLLIASVIYLVKTAKKRK